MPNPFDPRSVLLAKHAQHVVVIHFPIALFISGVVFDLLSRGKRASTFANVAYFNLRAAALTVFPAIVTGILAWQFALEGKRLKGLLLFHLLGAGCAAALLFTTWLTHWRIRQTEQAILPSYRVPLELAGVAVIGITAHLGGFLSGVNF